MTRWREARGPHQDSADLGLIAAAPSESTLNKVNTALRKANVPGGNPRRMVRASVRRATLEDLDILVRHRRGMWKDIAQIPKADLDVADRVYRRWARSQMNSNRLEAFIVETGGEPIASGCVWLMHVQPRPD